MTDATLPSPGSLVGGKFLLERYIAEGGMGVIGVGRHVELDEPVALKFVKPEVVAADKTGEVVTRFVREARATIKIRSEHVPRILDVATLENGIPYIAMELLVGEDVDKRLERSGPFPIALAIDLMLQALEALAAAHRLGMVHRDLKPANLFLGEGLDGTTSVKVLDFGIAKVVDTKADHGVTATNAVMGSPRYMAPEQMRASRDVDVRADIWAVGTTLYEILTGVPPFDGETLPQVCAAILQDEPEPMPRRRPEIPPALDAVVRRCLEKRAPDRYPDVAALAAALAPFGTAPAAQEAAARVARVLGAPRSAASDPSLVLTQPPELTPASDVSRPSLGTPSASSGVGQTNVTWGTMDSPVPGRPRWVWPVVTGVALLLGVGSVIAGVSLFRAPSGSGPRALGSTGIAEAPVSAPSAPVAVPTPPAVTEAAPSAPVATASVRVATSASSAIAAPAVVAKPPPAPADVRTAAKPTGGPTPAPAPVKPSTTKGANGGGLWDDRK